MHETLYQLKSLSCGQCEHFHQSIQGWEFLHYYDAHQNNFRILPVRIKSGKLSKSGFLESRVVQRKWNKNNRRMQRVFLEEMRRVAEYEDET